MTSQCNRARSLTAAFLSRVEAKVHLATARSLTEVTRPSLPCNFLNDSGHVFTINISAFPLYDHRRSSIRGNTQTFITFTTPLGCSYIRVHSVRESQLRHVAVQATQQNARCRCRRHRQPLYTTAFLKAARYAQTSELPTSVRLFVVGRSTKVVSVDRRRTKNNP